jgi:membrane-associated phospholipid phosphatase
VTGSVAALSLAGYTAWTRVHDNRHHPSDVIAGSALGLTAALVSYLLHNRTPLSASPVRVQIFAGPRSGGLGCGIVF